MNKQPNTKTQKEIVREIEQYLIKYKKENGGMFHYVPVEVDDEVKYKLNDDIKEKIMSLLSSHAEQVRKEERERMSREIKKWAKYSEPKYGLAGKIKGEVFYPTYRVVFKNDLMTLLEALSSTEQGEQFRDVTKEVKGECDGETPKKSDSPK